MWIWIGIIAVCVALDQVSKWLAIVCLTDGESVNVIRGVFRFTYVENRGAAFGMLSDHRWIFMLVSCVAIVGLLIYLWKYAPNSKWVKAALSLVIGGGIGNMIDRIARNYVVDFLDFCAFPNLWPWVFNLADAFVCVGAGILLVWCLWALVKEFRASKKKGKETRTEEESPRDSSDS